MRISISEAVDILKIGGIVALPTETVYGIAAAVNCPEAIKEIYNIKQRPLIKPITINCASVAQVRYYLKTTPPDFEQLAQNFWPGPLTLVLPIHEEKIDSSIRVGLPSSGFRIPNQKDILAVLQEVGPLVLPSANISGDKEAVSADEVEAVFGEDFPVVDGGVCTYRQPSTVVEYCGNGEWAIRREGVLKRSDIFVKNLI